MTRSLLALGVVAVLAGCGGSSKPSFPTVGAARTYALVDFKPTAPAVAGKPTRVSFVIRQPDGKPLTSFRRGPGPHTGVHLIFVRKDLSTIVHRHPPIAKDGTISDTITFADPGPYRLVVDAYPDTTGPQRNFQLFGALRVAGTYHPSALPPFAATVDTDGYRFTMTKQPSLHAIQAGFLTVRVTDPQGKPVRFTPWYGALAHAIFFRRGSLDYFHTHVCAPGAAGCTSTLGATKVTGSSSTPGKLDVGVLVPVSGEWRLFIQCRVAGRVLTAPFTLQVRP
ncbi:MAG: hypothetical protein QOE63_965 [Acidimicrobiaceae bacterium]